MKLLSLLFLVIALTFVCAEDEIGQAAEANEKVDKEPEPIHRQTAKRKQFSNPTFPERDVPRFRPHLEFDERPVRFQSPRQLDRDPRFFQQPELMRRPVFMRDRPQFDEPHFHMEPTFRHIRPQQVRAIDQMRIPSPDMFADQHSFSLPASQFAPVRMHHSPPQQQPVKVEKTPVKSADPFSSTFFNMPFSSVAMTPFKVTTALDEDSNKPQQDKESEKEALKQSSSDNFRFVPQEMLRRPFSQPESQSILHRPVQGPQQFGGLRTADEFPQQEFLEPFPPVRRPPFSQFEHPDGSSFEFHPEEMSFGAPISFHIEPGQLEPSKPAQEESSKTKTKEEPKKSSDENLKSTAAISSGIKFRPFGVAPIQFQNPDILSSDSLRSAVIPSAEPSIANHQQGNSPFRPIILRPVKLLSPQGSDITKSASSSDDEFKAFMTVSEDDLQPMESSTQKAESLSGRHTPMSQESDVVIRKPVVRRLPVQSTHLVRVRPSESENSKLVAVSKPSASSSQPSSDSPLRFRNAPSRGFHLRPVSSSFVEYRLQPSYVRTFRKGPSPLRASSRIYYEPTYFNPKLYDHDNFERKDEPFFN